MRYVSFLSKEMILYGRSVFYKCSFIVHKVLDNIKDFSVNLCYDKNKFEDK